MVNVKISKLENTQELNKIRRDLRLIDTTITNMATCDIFDENLITDLQYCINSIYKDLIRLEKLNIEVYEIEGESEFVNNFIDSLKRGVKKDESTN